MSQSTELALLPPKETALQVFSVANGLDPYLQVVLDEVSNFVPDISTAKGRKEIASMARKVASSKIALDNMGKDLVAEMKKVPLMIDAERKRMRDILDKTRDDVRSPLTEYEEKEAQRIDYYTRMIQHIVDCGNGTIAGVSHPFCVLIRELNEKITIDASWAEFEAKALREKDAAITKLEAAMEEQHRRDEEQAELEKLRQEKAERERKDHEARIAREAAEAARLEAEHAAAKERARIQQEAAQRELEHKAAIERAEREKAEAEALAKLKEKKAAEAAEAARVKAEEDKQAAILEEQRRAQEEQRRIQEAKDAEAVAEAKRAANKANQRAKNNEILDDLALLGISRDDGQKIVTAIVKGSIRNLQINY